MGTEVILKTDASHLVILDYHLSSSLANIKPSGLSSKEGLHQSAIEWSVGSAIQVRTYGLLETNAETELRL